VRLQGGDHLTLIASGVTSDQDFAIAAVLNGQAGVAIGMRRALCQITATDLSTAENPRDHGGDHSEVSLRAAAGLLSFAAAGASPQDHSRRMEKNPVTFSAICRASSREIARPNRGCQTAIVWSIRLSLAARGTFIAGDTA